MLGVPAGRRPAIGHEVIASAVGLQSNASGGLPDEWIALVSLDRQLCQVVGQTVLVTTVRQFVEHCHRSAPDLTLVVGDVNAHLAAVLAS